MSTAPQRFRMTVSAAPSFRLWGTGFRGTWAIYIEGPGEAQRLRASGKTKNFGTIKEAHATAKAAMEDTLRRLQSGESVPWPDGH